MNIINIGILAHVDAGKTTLTESLLYASGTISEPGSVEKGTTRTDTMFLERQRGITIQTAVTSFQWHSCKVNIVDTPGHMDFLAEVYRSLAVLDGAILVLSAKDGVQAQTRVLFHALRKLNIPTIIFINKIDQVGIDLESVYQSVRDKLSADIIIKQTVSLSSKITLTENTSAEVWDSVIENNDELLAKYIAGESISQKELAQEEQRRVQDASLLPVYHGSAKNGLGIQQLMDAVIGLFQSTKEQGSAALCGRVFKVEYTDCGQRLVYLRLYSGTLRLRDTVALAGREKLKITEMRIPSKGEIVRTDTAHKGEIVILPSDSLRLNDILGDKTQLPREMWSDVPFPMLRTTITPKTAEQRDRLLDALTQIADTDPLLHYEVDSTTHEIILSFLGRMQLEVVSALLTEKYKIETAVKEPTVIYLERPLKVASHTIHIEVPPNPFWASIGLSVTPLPLGSGVKYESRVSRASTCERRRQLSFPPFSKSRASMVRYVPFSFPMAFAPRSFKIFTSVIRTPSSSGFHSRRDTPLTSLSCPGNRSRSSRARSVRTVPNPSAAFIINASCLFDFLLRPWPDKKMSRPEQLYYENSNTEHLKIQLGGNLCLS